MTARADPAWTRFSEQQNIYNEATADTLMFTSDHTTDRTTDHTSISWLFKQGEFFFIGFCLGIPLHFNGSGSLTREDGRLLENC
jgi:hypothetical protein